jgi:hypothetical protein
MYHTLGGFSAWPCAAATAPDNPATIPPGAMTNFDPAAFAGRSCYKKNLDQFSD